MKLSKRLTTIASFVEKGSNIADIGTDHGYVPIYLINEGIANSAIAMDIRKGPLSRAEEHIREQGLSKKIETRLSDGLIRLHAGEADTVIIAGMGGELTLHILECGRHLWNSIKDWILSPQSELDKVRRFLESEGFFICQETMIEEDGKYYTIIKAVSGRMKYDREIQYLYGGSLITEGHSVLKEYLKREEEQLWEVARQLQHITTDSACERYQEIQKRLMLNKEAQDGMQ